MLGLRSAPPAFSVAEAEKVARDVYGVAATVTALAGERDCNFQVRTASGAAHVLKIMNAAADPVAADCQRRVLEHLAQQDAALPVPRLSAGLDGAVVGRFDRDGVGFCTCLLSFLPGRPLSAERAEPPLLEHLGRSLARLDNALQGFFHPGLAQRMAWDVRRLPELRAHASAIASAAVRQLVLAVIEALERRLPALRGLRSQAIHGDFHGGNVLVDGAVHGVSGILDFGDMIHAPLILEPAVAMSELLTEGVVTDTGALAVLLEGYAQAGTLAAADVEALYDLIAARHATTLLLHGWRTQHDVPGAALLDQAAGRAGASLDQWWRQGADRLTREWHRAAGTGTAEPVTIDLGRRHRLLGTGAELFYEQPLHLERGAGVWLYDPAGHAYLDAYNNVPHVGHCHPVVVRAIQRQTAVLATHTRYLHGRVLDYAERLLARCPAHLDACIFVNSGSEANDVAWRIAQLATGNRGALIVAHAYHGITDAVAALTPGAGQPHDPRVVTVSPPPEGLMAAGELTGASAAAAAADAERALRVLAGRQLAPAAFFIDTALTSSGIYDPPPAWSAVVTDRIRAAGGLIVADEVQYGLGRSGSHFWGFERRGITPDLVTLGKPMANGYPMGAVIGNRRMIEAFQAKFGFFSTFGGNAVAAAAGIAVLQVIERERLRENAATTGAYLRLVLEEVAAHHACLGAVRGTGLLLGLEVRGADAAAAKARTRTIVNTLASRCRILIGSEGPAGSILKIRPPLPFRPEHADRLAAAIGAAAIDP